MQFDFPLLTAALTEVRKDDEKTLGEKLEMLLNCKSPNGGYGEGSFFDEVEKKLNEVISRQLELYKKHWEEDTFNKIREYLNK